MALGDLAARFAGRPEIFLTLAGQPFRLKCNPSSRLKRNSIGVVTEDVKGATMAITGKLRTVAVALALILGIGASAVSTAQAQRRDDDRRDRDRERAEHRSQERSDRWRHWDHDRDRDHDRDWNRGRYYGYRGYTYRGYPYYGGNYGYYGPYGGYGNYGGYYGSGSEGQGYRDGYNRGREDAHSGRYPTPNNSEHFRNGNPAYRAGFARGYQAGYRSVTGGYGYGGYRPF